MQDVTPRPTIPNIIKLSDDELDAVLRAELPLDPDLHDAFLRGVYAELTLCREIGPGVVYRVAREQQARLFRSPISDQNGVGRAGVGKYAKPTTFARAREHRGADA
jgi:hypothetical protein